MAHSYAEYADIACPHCEKRFRAPIWLIVDLVERPDLMEAILNNTVHDLTCPNCNQNIGWLDTALLLYYPRAAIMLFDEIITSILFSPAQRSSKEERIRYAQVLVSRLKNSLGEEWQDFWVAQGLPFLTREQLLTFVRSFPNPHIDRQMPAPLTREERAREIIEALVENRPCVWGTHELDDTLLAAYADAYAKAERVGKRIEEVGELQRLRDMFVQLRLDRLLKEISQWTPPGNPARRAQLCSWVLSLIDREHDPALWAQLQTELGLSLIQEQENNDQGEHIERAIEAFQNALHICNAQKYPKLWPTVVQSLATAYIDRVQGDRAENVERAIELYQQVLTVLTPYDGASTWALTMYNLGHAYMERAQGNRAENIERAIETYLQELQVTTRQASPMNWAATMLALAEAYKKRLQGDKDENMDLATTALEQVLEVYRSQAEPSLQIEVIEDLARAYINRESGNHTENNDRAIELYQQALELSPYEKTPVKWAQLTGNMANIYYMRSDGDRAEHIEQAIVLTQLILEVMEHENMLVEWARAKRNLAMFYRDRIREDKAKNIADAIEACQQALQVLVKRVSPEEWIDTLILLTNAYYSRPQMDEAENLEQVIQVYKQAFTLEGLQDAPIAQALIMKNLGIAYQKRILGNSTENLEQAIRFIQQALFMTRADSSEWVQEQMVLGSALVSRFRRLGDAADINAAIESYKQALSVAVEGATIWSECQAYLAVALRFRFEAWGHRVDLEAAITASQQSITLDGEGLPEYLWRHVALAEALSDRFEVLKQREDIDTSIEILQLAVERGNEERDSIAWYQSALGDALMRRYLAFGYRSDLDSAIESAYQALTLTGEKAPNWPKYQGQYSMALFNRFELAGDVSDIDTAVAGLRMALAMTNEVTFDWATLQSNLGAVLSSRFEKLGHVPDIDAAITALRQAVRLAQKGSPASAARQSNLGLALYRRFNVLGKIADLESAVEAFEQAFHTALEENSMRKVYQAHLAMVLRTRFEVLGQEHDIDLAIQLYREVLSTPLKEGPDWARWHNNLGNALTTRFQARGQTDDLDEAIDSFQLALRAVQTGSVDWAKWRRNLGHALRVRFEALKHIEDLNAAIDILQSTPSMIHEGSPDWAKDRANLGLALTQRFNILGIEADRDEAIKALEEALAVFDPELWPVYILDLATTLCYLYLSLSSWTKGADTLLKEVKAINTLYRTQLLDESREVWLAHARDAYRNAAYVLARAGRLQDAVVTLEQGRARSLNTALARNRADLERVQTIDPAIYELYQQANTRLRMLEMEERIGYLQATGNDIQMDHKVRREQASLAWDDLNEAIIRIRQIPGYETFLEEPSFADVAMAVQPGLPLIYLVTTSIGSLALILHRPNKIVEVVVDDVWIDTFTDEGLKTLLVKLEGENVIGGYLPGQLDVPAWLKTSLENMLPLLGESLMTHVAAHIRPITAGALVLIPTGHLSLLPLHAASYNKDGFKVHLLDEFDVTYVPAARVLASACAVKAGNDQYPLALLGIGNPLPNLNPLMFARAELESVQMLFTHAARYLFYEHNATKAVLQGNLSNATHIHLSCHGIFDPHEPLKSQLQLAQGDVLTLQEILDQQRLPKNHLVVLSACQTAITEFFRLPDETIGFPAGFLQIGAPGVVGTLWSVDDLSTALLMAKFYELYLHFDSTAKEQPASAASALCRAQRWLRDVTNSGLLAYLQSEAPSLSPILTSSILPAVRRAVRMGRGNECPYTDPYHWAGVVYFGAL